MGTFLAFIIQLIILFFSIIVHEVSHGYVALIKGDPTAKYSGRLTLNPLPHIDVFGTIILPILLLVMRAGIIFGWAKPVPINPYNLGNPKKDMMWIGAAGPASNFGIAIVLSIFFRVIRTGLGYTFIDQFLMYAIAINILLAIFNLIPIPPLDGSRILEGVLPYEVQLSYKRIEPFGFLIIFPLLIILFPFVLLPIMRGLFFLLTGVRFMW
ncbi:MAG TPA: site-2 protease family protein [bacterium (Candidatus Stahlbacteria)]|nr:site-2 protease family protein [Candidatus Stahlbacteria bacterium]